MSPATRDHVRTHLPGPVDVAIVLGSGLGGFADGIGPEVVLATTDIPGYPRSTVAGHAGRIMTALHGRLRLMLFQGRIHNYEGYPFSDVILPVLLARACGAHTVIITNAAGGLNPRFAPGTLMAITDQLITPMTREGGLAMEREIVDAIQQSGLADDGLDLHTGRRWDLRDTHRDLILPAAFDAGVAVEAGVYSFASGPTYETRAEIRFLRRTGADAVGMSTVPEIVAATMLGMRVVGISCITNAAKEVRTPVSHAEVTTTANTVGRDFSRLVHAIIGRIEADADDPR